MAEWLVEEGIGEHRAILLDGSEVIAARLDWHSPDSSSALTAGQVEDALLVARAAGSKRGTLRFANGEEALVDGLPREASEGAPLRAVITRAAIAEHGRLKRAHARPTTDAPCPPPNLAARLRGEGARVRTAPSFPAGDWEDIFDEAWRGVVDFDGGSLIATPTPAMTLIDIDGALPPRALALGAVPAIAKAIRRLDLAGSIGIDFPSLAEKADRKAVDETLADALTDWPHQSTAMNGFGFIQLVARLERPSLLQRIARDRAGAAARLLLRQAERVADPGALLLTAHPAVRSATKAGWEAELARRTGRVLRWREDPTLALEAGFAQAVPL